MIIGWGQKVCVGDLVIQGEHVGKIVDIHKMGDHDSWICFVVWLNHWGVGEMNCTGKTLDYRLTDLFTYATIVRPEVY